MPTETRRINRLALQIAQDGHLSFGQKWRNLVMEVFGEEGIIRGKHLTNKTAFCGIFNIEIFRLHNNTEKYPLPLAKRKLFNPFKWIEFIISLLQFLPWFFHRSVRNIAMYLRDKEDKKKKKSKNDKKNGESTDLIDYFLTFCFFLCVCICIPLHLAAHLTLGILKRVLAPVRYIIRPSIELYKAYPALFVWILLATLFLTALLTLSLLTGNFALVIGGIAFTASLGTQIAVIGLAAIMLWVALLKVSEILLDLKDISQNFRLPEEKWLPDMKIQKQPWTSLPSQQWHRLHTEYTDVREPKKQNTGYSAALFFGVESVFYPPENLPV